MTSCMCDALDGLQQKEMPVFLRASPVTPNSVSILPHQMTQDTGSKLRPLQTLGGRSEAEMQVKHHSSLVKLCHVIFKPPEASPERLAAFYHMSNSQKCTKAINWNLILITINCVMLDNTYCNWLLLLYYCYFGLVLFYPLCIQ